MSCSSTTSALGNPSLLLRLSCSIITHDHHANNNASIKFQPLNQQINVRRERDLKRQLAVMERNQGGAKERLKQAQEIIKKNNAKIEEVDVSLGVASQEISRVDDKRKLDEKNRTKYIDLLRTKQEQYDRSAAALPKIKERIQTASAELAQADASAEEIEDKISDLQAEENDLLRRQTFMKREIENLQNPSLIYLEKLKKSNHNGKWNSEISAFKSILQDPSRFKMEVIGPIGLHLNVEDPDAGMCSLARSLGSFIPYSSFMSSLLFLFSIFYFLFLHRHL